MRGFLLKYGPFAVLAVCVLEVLIAIACGRRYQKTKDPLALCVCVLTAGLVYDAAVCVLGSVIGEGGFLKTISFFRYLFSGILIPLLLPIGFYGIKASDQTMKIVWIAAVLIMVAGAASAFATKLEAREIAGIVRYAAADSTPKWADLISMLQSVGMVVPLILLGIWAWVKRKNPLLFLGGAAMFAFSALGPATGNTDLIFMISMFGELLMVLCMERFSAAAK